jgi:type VI secretion system protein ImpL
MKTRLKVWLLSFITFFVFMLAAGAVGIFGDALPGRLRFQLQVALIGFGLVASAVVMRFLKKRWKGRIRGEKAAKREDKLASTFKAARKRLANSPKADEKNLRKLPTILILGPRGATKTTVVEQSGLNTELLEGETHRGETIVPTELVNLWYAEGTVLVEAGGALIDEPEKWEALLSYTQPARLAAALGLGVQAPRVALVCVACDEFTQPGAGESMAALGRRLRDRLVEAAEALGIRLPVYVLFTRADRLPYYDDFVRTLGRDEADQALGVTMPVAPASSAPYAEAQGGRIERYLNELLHALRLKRRDFLMRERDAEVQAGMYEFPREIEKIRGHIHSFLLELCRPSQLGRSPFLRGFHFTGVRALVVDEPGAPAPVTPTPTDAGSMGATQVFDLSKIQAAARQAAAGRSRRIPDWAFLKPFFRDVVMPDEVARVTTTGGARVDFLRRGLLTTAAVAAVVWGLGLVVSYRANRATAERVAAAAGLVQETDFRSDFIASQDDLERLDTLRSELVELRRHAVDGRPLGMRWGLYRGDDILEPGLGIYLDAFETAMGGEARRILHARLAGLPAEPDESTDFRSLYDALKAYLILTDHPDRSDVAFLPPAVLENWDTARNLDGERGELFRAQWDFFAEVIADVGNPPAPLPEATTVASSRDFLRELSNEDQFYLNVLGQAAAYGEEIRLYTAVRGSEGLLRNEVIVEPHFTLGAFDWVRDVDAREMLQSEDWVLGPQSMPIEDVASLGESVKARYRSEYAGRWLEFLAATSVTPFNGAADAARRLDGLASSESPLLGTLSLVARNTRPFADEFQPVLSVYPPPPPGEEEDALPEEDTRLIRDTNQSYVDALRQLEGALDALAQAPRDAQQAAVGQANDAVRGGEGAVDGMADAFALEPAAARDAGSAVRGLLQAPLRNAERLLGGFGAGQINGAGASFCREFGGFLSGYPFDRDAPNNASMEDVTTALQPGQSVLWSFIRDELEASGLVVQQGSRFSIRTGADPTPTSQFMGFLNQAADISSALFDAQGNPVVQFTLLPTTTPQLPEITIRIDNITQRTTPVNQREVPFRWAGQTARDVLVTAVIDGSEETLLEVPPGPWALFRLFETAQWSDLGSDRYQLSWTTSQGQVLQARLTLTDSPPVFRPGVLSGLSCVRTIVR